MKIKNFAIQKINKRKVFLLLSLLIFFLIFFKSNNYFSNIEIENFSQDTIEKSSITENFDGVDMTSVSRAVNIEGTGLITVTDTFNFKNEHDNPISFIAVGVNQTYLDNLIYYAAEGAYKETLDVQFSEELVQSYKMMYIFLDTPLLPEQLTSITLTQIFKDVLNFTGYYTQSGVVQTVGFNFYIYPVLPYQADIISTTFFMPDGGTNIKAINDSDEVESTTESFMKYSAYLTPTFNYKHIVGEFSYTTSTKLQIDSLSRRITFSSMGYLVVEETFVIHNTGPLALPGFIIKVPAEILEIEVFDDIGPITGASLSTLENIDGKTKDLSISLANNRANLNPNMKFICNLKYYLQYESYHAFNWIEQSITINMFLTLSDFIIYDQEVEIVIDGCRDISSVSKQPNSIETAGDDKILKYITSVVSPLDEFNLKIIYTLDPLSILMRPILLTIFFALALAAFVVLTKIRKPEDVIYGQRREDIPAIELRQFISFYEEKNAIFLEIQQSDDDVKRRKLTKKKYINIIKKHESIVRKLDEDLAPLKEIIEQSTGIFNKTFKNFDDLEAERLSIKDSLNLLENRYRQGKMPSREAYEKLQRNLLKKRDKIRKSVDRLINEMKAYLI